jgi:hypothetical protein
MNSPAMACQSARVLSCIRVNWARAFILISCCIKNAKLSEDGANLFKQIRGGLGVDAIALMLQRIRQSTFDFPGDQLSGGLMFKQERPTDITLEP